MKNFTFRFVIKQIPYAIFYFVLGLFFGVFSGLYLFYFNKEIYEYILNIWSRRILFGINIFGETHYKTWFILNNLFAILMIIVASVLMMIFVTRRRKANFLNKKFVLFEKRHPKITLYSLYLIPIGALIINGFTISFFLIYTLLTFGFSFFAISIALILPHGINEILALILASSLGLSYIKFLSTYILRKKWSKLIEIGKKLLLSKITLFFVSVILILIIFSGYVEGSLASLIAK